MLYERKTDNKNAFLCQKCENVDTTFFTSMNKHESTLPEDASTQVTACMTHWFLQIYLYIFSRL